MIDPVCLFHGQRKSKHDCLVCSLCYKDLTPAECNTTPAGELESVCIPCAEAEAVQVSERADGRGRPHVRPALELGHELAGQDQVAITEALEAWGREVHAAALRWAAELVARDQGPTLAVVHDLRELADRAERGE